MDIDNFRKQDDLFPYSILGYYTKIPKDSLFYSLMECIIEHGHNTEPETLLSICNGDETRYEEKEILAAKLLLTYFKNND